jgi:DNA repair exonuclease SbcCD nuclease subunit
MANTKWAIFTDLHLGVHQNSSTWHNIGLKWADWFVNELKSKDIDQIIFTGDFFHSRSEISVNTIHAASEFIAKFKDFSKIYMIVGNHDSYYKQKADVHSLSILNGYSNISVFDKTTTLQSKEFNSKAVTFCPWGFDYVDIPDSDVIFGHFEIESFKMNAHKLCEEGVKPKDLIKKSPLIFSGHFHLNEEREYDNGKIIYVGSPFQLDFGERDCNKGYYTIDFKDLNYEFFRNEVTPVHKKLLLSEILDGDEIKEEYKQQIKNNFVRIVIDSKIDQSKIDNILHVANSYTPISLTVDPLINYNLAAEQESADLSGVDISKAIIEFVNLLDIQEKEEVIKHTLYLYNQALKHE